MEDRKILKSLLEGIINEQKSNIDSIKKSVESIDDSTREKIILHLDSLSRINDTLNKTLMNLLDDTPNIFQRENWYPNYPYQPNIISTSQDQLCPNCGTPMQTDYSVVLTSNPPQYTRKCPKCGYIDYVYKDEITYEQLTNIKNLNNTKVNSDVSYENKRTNKSAVTRDEFHQIISDLESGKNPTLT